MRRWYFSLVNMINYDPHLFRVDLYNPFDLFFLTKNFISRSYHGHLSNFWKWRIYVLCKLTFKLFDYLLIVRKMHLFNTCQNKQRFITHMCIQLSTLKCSCLKHRLAWSTVIGYGVWGKRRKLVRDFSINRLENDILFFLRHAFEIWKFLSDIFSVSLEDICSFKKSIVFGSFVDPRLEVSIIVHLIIFNLLLLLSTLKKKLLLLIAVKLLLSLYQFILSIINWFFYISQIKKYQDYQFRRNMKYETIFHF